MTMRSSTGSVRTSSQISIYDYPDHLNPFAEDDNHKRLRFWNLSKRNDNRRRSFSMGNLREFWNLKSFSLKKKSSTLGIHKTSESPPVLRRSLDPNSLHPGDRGAYTNSLQNMSTPRGIRSSERNFRVVNSPQRSTISEGYLTPLSQRFHPNRSSQASLNSTNPFESDMDSDATDIGSVSLGRKSYRKKRRAPLAPTREMLNNTSPSPVKETAVEETQIEIEQNKAIRSLAVEIEQFVNSSNETSTVKVPKVIVEPSSVPQSPKTESPVTEPTYLAKVPNDTVRDETKQTVICTSKSDPVTETVQLDKSNSRIVVSSVVFDERQQTQPKLSDHKSSPVVAPRRSHASRNAVERAREAMIKNAESTSTSDTTKSCHGVHVVETTTVTRTLQSEHKTQEPLPEPAKEIKLPIKEQNGTESKCYGVHIVESPRAEHTTQKQEEKPDLKLSGNVVQIVETTKVSQSPKAEHRTTNQVVNSQATKEFKIPNTEKTSTHDPKLNNTLVQIVETTNTAKNPPAEPSKEIQIPNMEHTTTGDRVSETKNTQVKTVKIAETSFVSERTENAESTPRRSSTKDSADETKIRNVEYTSISKPAATNVVETSFVPQSPVAVQRVPEQIRSSEAPEHVPVETKIRNLDYASTSSPVTKELSTNGNLQQVNENRNLNNFATVQRSYFKANNNNDEYLNKPLAIFENSERKVDRSDDGTQPAKAKSVKEIIDSINRSQKLLKDSAAKGTTVYSTSLYTENNNVSPINNQRSSQLTEISPNISTGSTGAENNLQMEQSYFQKSKINKTAFQSTNRESSPTALNLDWNPLPKPKRINNGSTM